MYQTQHYFQRRPMELHRAAVVFFSFMFVALIMCFPDMAHAAFDGKFSPNSETVANSNKSVLDWWRVISYYGIWASVIAFFFSLFALGGRFWWVPLVAAFVCLFGETFVTGVASWQSGGTAGTN